MPPPGPYADRQAVKTLLNRLADWRSMLAEQRTDALDWDEVMLCLRIRPETLRRLERMGYIRTWRKSAADSRQTPCPAHKLHCKWVKLEEAKVAELET